MLNVPYDLCETPSLAHPPLVHVGYVVSEFISSVLLRLTLAVITTTVPPASVWSELPANVCAANDSRCYLQGRLGYQSPWKHEFLKS